MAEVITPDSLGFIGGFGPAAPPEEFESSTSDEPSVTTTEPSEEKNSVDNKAENKQVVPTKQSLGDLIRADREARQNKVKESETVNKVNTEITQLKAEIAKLKSTTPFEDDPVGYVKSKQLTPDQQIALGEALIYDLAPDKAPPELRYKLFEQRHKRQEQARAAAEAEKQQAQQIEYHNKQVEAFALQLEANVAQFTPDSYPESESWFDGDSDNYLKSLMATAENLAKTAQATGRPADLSAANIAKTLEAEISSRMSKRDKRKTGVATTKTETKSTNTESQATSIRGLTSNSASTVDMSENARLKRAMDVAFGRK